MKQAVRERLAALGRDLTPEFLKGTVDLLAPTAARPDTRYGRMLYDQSYGSHEHHRIDLYGIQSEGSARPIVVYIHGGGFIAGDKGGPEKPFYRNVGAWAAANGMVGAIPNYRLAPAHPWPNGRDDVIAAIEWLRSNAAKFGGDPEKIWLVGQSAGAAHVASAVAELQHQERDYILKGAIMISGIYDPTLVDSHPGNIAYYGADVAARAAYSSIPGLLNTQIPCLFTVSELDPVMFQQQAALIVRAFVEARGAWPHVLFLPHHNHLSPAQTLGASDEDDFGPLLLQFMADVNAQTS